jgi:hypothetical protein
MITDKQKYVASFGIGFISSFLTGFIFFFVENSYPAGYFCLIASFLSAIFFKIEKKDEDKLFNHILISIIGGILPAIVSGF